MSEDKIKDELADMRRLKKPTPTNKSEQVNDKAQTAREARMAKMASKEGGKSQVAATEATAVDISAKEETTTTAILAEHTVASGDTLTHIAQKYYNSTARDKWMSIYEANKEIIGDNPSLIRVGQSLKIPMLSD